MRYPHRHSVLSAALAAAFAVSIAASSARADEKDAGTNPGFVPATGRINLGFDKKNPTTSEPRKIPTPAEARAAKMMPGKDQPSVGSGPVAGIPPAKSVTGDQKDSQNASGGPQATQAGRIPDDGSGEPGGTKATTGSGMSQSTAAPASEGPIGATGQTMPSTLSKRNDILDRVPIMAQPMALNDEQRRQIYRAVMADKAPAATDADALAPASQLTTHQALNETHPLPAGLAGIPNIKDLTFLKTKNKVLLIEPATRIVVEEIES